jgi:MFS family permease
LVRVAPAERRGEVIGTALAAAIAGALFGPVLGGAADHLGRGPVFAAVGLMGMLLIVWAALTPAPPPGPGSSMRRIGELRKLPAAVFGGSLIALAGLLFGVLDVLAPLRLDALGASASAIAVVFLIAAGMEASVSPIAGRLSDRIGRLGPILPGLVFTTVAMAALTLPDRAWVVALLVIAVAPAIGLLWAPAMAMLSDAASSIRLDQAYAFGIVNLTWAGGQTIGAVAGAGLAEGFGDAVPYLIVAALCAFAAWRVVRSPLRLAPPSNGSGSHG